MRQIFSSARLENVEAVAGLLRDAGIEIRISNDRSYRGNRRSHFSYREPEGRNAASQPAVWIINADEQPRARQLMRDAGLLDSTREGASSYLPASALKDGKQDPHAKARRKTHIKLTLLIAILIVIGLLMFGPQKTSEPAPPAIKAATPALADIVPQSAEDLQVYRVDMPTALAKRMVDDALATRKPAQACITIDGSDPSADFLKSLQAGSGEVLAGSACTTDALRIDVRDYMTDGSGSGTVSVQLNDDAARSLDVERDGTIWNVLGKR